MPSDIMKIQAVIFCLLLVVANVNAQIPGIPLETPAVPSD